ncbi:MAG: DNA-binding protein [Burkholderiales bacterium]|jgi:DNA-binding phage protein
MPEKIKIDELPPFDAAPYLDSKDAIAVYLTDILETNDAAMLASAIDDIARACISIRSEQ